MILNERHIRRLIKEAINNIMEAEIDPDTGLALSDDGGAAARDAKADAAFQASRSGMFYDVTTLSRIFDISMKIINELKAGISSYDRNAAPIDGSFKNLIQIPGDERLVTIASGAILAQIRAIDPTVTIFHELQTQELLGGDISQLLGRLLSSLGSLKLSAESANSPGRVAGYQRTLEIFQKKYPEYAEAVGVDKAISRTMSQAAAGTESGIKGEIDAMISARGGGAYAPNEGTIDLAAPVLQRVMDGKTLLARGSSGPAVEVVQRLLAMALQGVSNMGYESAFAAYQKRNMSGDELLSAAHESYLNLEEDGFDGVFGKNTEEAVKTMQTIMQSKQETMGVMRSGVLTYTIDNPALVDGKVGSQTLGALVRGDFNRAISAIKRASKSDRISGGTERK